MNRASPLDSLVETFGTALLTEGGLSPRGGRRAFSPKTVAEYQRTVRMFSRRLDLLAPPAKVTQELTTWRRQVQRDLDAGRITRSKIRNDVHALRAFFSWLERAGRYTGNPARAVQSTPPGRWKPRPAPLTTVQDFLGKLPVRRPDGSLDPEALRDRVLLELPYNGLRREEVCRANQHELEYHELLGNVPTLSVLAHGKREKSRRVPLSPNSAALVSLHLLHQYEAEWEAWCADFRAEFGAFAPVRAFLRLQELRKLPPGPLVRHKGERMKERTFNRIVARRRTELGIPEDVVPHRFRHTYATQLLNQGVDLRVIQTLLGHESITITQVYVDPSLGLKADAATALPASPAIPL